MMSTVLDAYLSLYNHASGHKDRKYQLLVWPSTEVLDKLLLHNVSSIYGKGKVVTFTLPEAYIQKEELHSFWYHYRFHAMPRCDNHHWWLYLFDSERGVVTQLNSLQQQWDFATDKDAQCLMTNINNLLQQPSEGKYHTCIIGIKKFRCIGNIVSVPQKTDLKMCGVCVCQNVDSVF